ncbi:hypothetical protein NPIL_15901 [Nephila pilipes]|uniref:Uncharacterized protein n=1 Tax=Nephila pilipes TaxID=299642 RepID=A0A8X6TP29_NEPPI|nr:hypothetical protein NPIL_15901 [Nephila pilipes]
MNSVPTSSGEENEIYSVANNATPWTTPANLDKIPTRDTESDDNNRFTVVNRKKKKMSFSKNSAKKSAQRCLADSLTGSLKFSRKHPTNTE